MFTHWCSSPIGTSVLSSPPRRCLRWLQRLVLPCPADSGEPRCCRAHRLHRIQLHSPRNQFVLCLLARSVCFPLGLSSFLLSQVPARLSRCSRLVIAFSQTYSRCALNSPTSPVSRALVDGQSKWQVRVLAGRLFMGSVVARTVLISRCWPVALARIWMSMEGPLASGVLQVRSFTDEGLDGYAPSCHAASSTAQLSGASLPGALTTVSFRAYRSVDDKHAYPVKKYDGYRIPLPSAVLEILGTCSAFNVAKRPVSIYGHSSRNVARKSSRSPRQGLSPELVSFGSACGPTSDTRLASPTSAGRAIAVLKNRQQQGLSLNFEAVIDALKQCSKQKDLIATRQLHDCIIRSGMHKHPYVAITLLNVYVKCGRLPDARRVFDGLQKTDRNVITWTVMIGAYAKSGYGMEAYRLFLQMNREGFIPDAATYKSILNATASAGALEWVKKVHSHALKAGLESDVRVGTALVHMYAKSGSIDDARLLFDRMEKRDVVTWTVLIGAYAERGCGMEAYGLFLQMQREGYEPNVVTYASILNAAASAGALEWVREVHSHALKAGLESDLRVANALVHMYAKSGSIDDARLLFDRMEKRDVVTWNTMIGAYAESGRGVEANGLFLQMKRKGFVRDVITWTIMIGAYAKSGSGVEAYRLFQQMNREGFIPDAPTYASILNAAASAGALEWVKEVHSHALKAGLESDLRVANSLVHMYAKSGSIDDARLLFDRMKKRDVVTWTAMIGGLAQHGFGPEALKLFRKMNEERVKPDGPTLVAVLSACSHAGLVEDGRRIFSAMKQDYGIEPTVVHYTCMVDILGRAGHLEEAKLLIDNMPVEPGAVTWKALLGACRKHSNVDLGELAAKEVFKMDPKDAATYVLLSNIYAATGKWEKVVFVRNMMQERGVRKEPGLSWIEVDDKIHEFVVSDTSHPEAKAIYRELEKLTEQLKAKGYIPDTKLVLLNIDEEAKELALCSHSEKLAIAYGLLRVSSGKPVRVQKNLRICPDCHAATKLISEVTGREIIVRDAIRFHHFRDGVCSCGDYW